MTVKDLLIKLKACKEAIEAHGHQTLQAAWQSCERGDWMLWLCARMAGKDGWPSRQDIVLAACSCAEVALPIFEQKYPHDKRPRTAIETARRWARGEVTLERLRAAAATAANDAATAAYANAAATAAAAFYAAYANAAATAAAYAAYAAANAAANAAYAAANAAAKRDSLRKSADICRKMLTVPEEM